MTDPENTSQKKPAKKRGCLKRLLAVICLAIAGAAIYLFAPASPPAFSLLSLMPANAPLGIELRDGSDLWQSMQNSGTLDQLKQTPACAEFLRHGIDLKSDIETLARETTRLLDQPHGWGQVERALGGAVAVSSLDADFRRPLVILKPDNLTSAFIDAWLLIKGKSSAGLKHFELDRNGEKLLIAKKNGLFVAARTIADLLTLADSVSQNDKQRGLFASIAPPASGIVCHILMTGLLREKLHASSTRRIWMLEESLVTAEMEDDGYLNCRTRSLLNPSLMERTVEGARKIRDWSPLEVSPAKTEDAEIWCAGWLAPEFALHAVSKRLWDEPARPLRGDSQPMTVLAWEWLDLGLVNHADGRMRISLHKSGQTDLPVPPAPEVKACWGISSPEKAGIDFADTVEKMVDFYRAPGGSVLYEKVRRETRLEKTDDATGSVIMHRLFWNGMRPTWKIENGIGAFSLNGSLPAAVIPQAKSGDKNLLAVLKFGWKLDESLGELRGFLHNKIVSHGFAPEESQPKIMNAIDLAVSVCHSLPDGEGILHMQELKTNAGMTYPLDLDFKVRVGSR